MARKLQFENLLSRLALSVTVAESEPNNTEVTPDPIALSADGQAILTGTSTSDKDKDYFTLRPTVGGPLDVSVQSPNGNVPQLEITDRAGNQLFETEPNDGINSGQVQLQSGVQYLLRLRSKDNDPAQYEVAIQFGGQVEGPIVTPQDPMPVQTVSETEPNDSRGVATVAPFGPDRMVRLTGTAESQNDNDFFRFTAPASGELKVAVTSLGGEQAKLQIEDAMGNKIGETEPNDGVNSFIGQVTAGTNYFVRVRSTEPAPAPYAVDLILNGGILLGDSDGSGQFDSADLVTVMQAGKYQSPEAASFAEGDWNADGVFNEQDLLVAFQAGRFVS